MGLLASAVLRASARSCSFCKYCLQQLDFRGLPGPENFTPTIDRQMSRQNRGGEVGCTRRYREVLSFVRFSCWTRNNPDHPARNDKCPALSVSLQFYHALPCKLSVLTLRSGPEDQNRAEVCPLTCTRGKVDNVKRLGVFPGIHDHPQQLAQPPQRKTTDQWD